MKPHESSSAAPISSGFQYLQLETVIQCQMNLHIDFLCNFLMAPRRVASLTPSGKSLATLITREIVPSDAPVIELGAGTGIFTRHLIGRGIPQEQLALVESGASFVQTLQASFPSSRVLCMDAARLGDVELFDGRQAGAVVSGLPLLSMAPLQVARVLRGAFAHLRPEGMFYQFTYGPRCPVPRVILERFRLQAHYVGKTMANLPPAAVFCISRKPGMQLPVDGRGAAAAPSAT